MKAMDYIDSVLIIDDEPTDVANLEEVLKSNDILYTFCDPKNLPEFKYRNRQIIFCDLYLSATATEVEGHISELRKILKRVVGKEFGSYGIVLWTSHLQHIDLVKEKISNDGSVYSLPLFIIGLDKTEYIKDGFSNIFEDLSKKLADNKAAHFFLNWRESISENADKTLAKIYSLIPDFKNQEAKLSYVLYLLAANYSGKPIEGEKKYDGMYHDAYKAFNEILYSELSDCVKSGFCDVFNDITPNPWKDNPTEELSIFSKLNDRLLIEHDDIDHNSIIPGNVYQVCDKDSELVLSDAPENAINIAIELTPPCDFSQNKKKLSRLIGGFILSSVDKEKWRSIKNNYKGERNYPIWPVEIEEKISLICFDFRILSSASDTALNDDKKFKLLFKVNHKLFSDILQKFSSHAARLGVSLIDPTRKVTDKKK